MLKVYTRINKKLALFEVDTHDVFRAWSEVNRETKNATKNIPIMVLVPVNEALNIFTRPMFA